MAANIYQAVKQAIQDLVAPQLESLKGEIARLDGKIDGLHGDMNALRGEMTSFRGEMRAELGGVRTEIRALDDTTRAHIQRLDERLTVALDLRERIVALEARQRN